MFRNLANDILGGGLANANIVLTQFTPLQLASYVEAVWSAPRLGTRAFNLPALQDMSPAVPSLAATNDAFSQAVARQHPVAAVNQLPGAPQPQPPLDPAGALLYNWEHLIGAFVAESTGIVEIMRRVITDWVHDERLPFASLESQYWMRATEELFFTSPSPYFTSLTSNLRSDAAAIRENAYQRMFGLVVPFRRDGTPASLPRPRITNASFVPKLERLLYECWRGYINRLNFGSEDRTDQQAVEELVREIREMLLSRRESGTLMREEAVSVATLSWFYLAVEHDTLVVTNLNAQAENAAERLRKIAALVGMQPSRVTDSYFQLVDTMSWLLMNIENQFFELLGVQFMYDNAVPVITQTIQNIILHWERATGRSIKDGASVKPVQIPVTAQISASIPAPATSNRVAQVTATV